MEHGAARSYPAMQWFEKLLDVPSPPGFEQSMGELIVAELRGMGYAPERDGSGNVLVSLECERPELPLTVMAAHMDELGFTITAIESDGRLRAIRSGGMLVDKTGERPVVILGSERTVTGVLSLGSTHQAERETRWTWKDARIITGLTPAALAEAGVHVGASGTLAREGRGPIFMGDEADPLVAAWTFDDRMGCVALLRLLDALRQEGICPKRPVTIAFTVHEEGSCHGAMSLGQRLKPDLFFAVDGCPVTEDMPLALDGRPGIWARDVKGIYDRHLVEQLCRMAHEEGIELQRAVYAHASSDASSAYAVGAAERIALVGHVRTNSHGFEVARLSVFDQTLAVLKRFVADYE